MFIYSEWNKFCSEVSSKYNCIRVDEIPHQPKNSSWISIKHDVETSVEKALKVAKIEKNHNIRATFFVQSYLLFKNLELLKEISDLGHEVTYHYDVLDSNRGNMSAAIEEFSKTVSEFEEVGFTVSTVCPHGNPLMQRNGWSSNKDFFRNKDVVKRFPDIFDLVVQLPERIGSDVVYISDAGYGWKIIANVDSNDLSNNGDASVCNMSELISLHDKVVISSHPHRWSESSLLAFSRLHLFKFVRTAVKTLAKVAILKKVFTRFYYLAKKL